MALLLLSLDITVNVYFSTSRLPLIFQDLILDTYYHLKVKLESIPQNKFYASHSCVVLFCRSVLQMLTLQVLFLTAADLLIETDKMEFCMQFKQHSSQKTRCWKWRKYRFLIKLIYFTPWEFWLCFTKWVEILSQENVIIWAKFSVIKNSSSLQFQTLF